MLSLLAKGSAIAQDTPREAPNNESEIPPDQLGDEGYLINFPNVNIIEYIRFISQITNKNFIYKDEDLQFNVTILSEEPTSIENIIAALVQILRIHDLRLLEQGNNLIIHKNKDISQAPRVVHDPSVETGIVTRVFQFKNVDPESILKIIKPLVSKGSLVEVSKETRHLIVTDIGSNVTQIGRLLEDLDAPNVSLDIGTYIARYTHIDSLVSLAEKIIQPLAESNPLVLVAQPSSNTIFIVSTPYLINRTMAILSTLDVPTKEEEDSSALPPGHIDNTSFYIHKLQYHLGDKLVKSLKDVGENLASVEIANQNLITTVKSGQWLESTNSLLFTGDSSSLKKVRELVSNLDVPMRQVLIEMLIISTTINKSLDFGIDWSGQARMNSTGIGLGNIHSQSATTNPLTTALPASAAAAIDPSSLILGKGFSLGAIGRAVSHNGNSYTSLGALVHALQSDSDTNILLNPRIVTQDTSPAQVFVGGTSAFQASQSVNAEGQIITVNVEYKDVGTLLKVTPILGPEKIITLDIEQEMSEDLSTQTAIQSGQSISLGPVTTKSTTKTRVHIPDDNFLIISGMIRDHSVSKRSSIPCLGGIPGFGKYIFGSVNPSSEKQNLMIFIRPHIVESESDIKNITEKHKNIYYKRKKKNQHVYDLDKMMQPYALPQP